MSEDLTTYENSDGHWVSEQEHRRIIAEKDREIAYLQECRTSAAAMDAQRTIEYQQLMEKAILFAERLDAMDKNSSVHWNDVDEFLKSPEVQAWKEHKP